MPIASSLIRSRSGAIVAAFSFSTLATGLTQIAVPLELRQLHATPNEIGITLSMFGLGMVLCEGLWGALADRIGYRVPILASQGLYAASLFLLASAGTVPLIAAGYLLASAMMVAAGPIGRSFIGTTLPPRLRATGLALIATQWVIGGAIGAGAGGQLIEHLPIREVIYGAVALPLISAVLTGWAFRGYRETRGIWSDEGAAPETLAKGDSFVRVMVVTASIVLLAEIGAGGELALLPLLVTTHLHQSAATAGAAMFVVGMFGGLMLVPGGIASDRWGRRGTMVVGGIVSAAGFVVYAIAGSFWVVVVGAALRAVGSSLIWPAATAWISEAAPRKRHALAMGLFGEFENLGIAVGPVVGGLAWSAFGIQAAFVAYAFTALLAAGVAGIAAGARAERAKIRGGERVDDRQPDRV